MKKMKSKIALIRLKRSLETCSEGISSSPDGKGWIRTVRELYMISINNLAEKLGISFQSVSQLEKKELKDEITIKKMKEVAAAMDCEFIFYFLPKDGDFLDNHKKHVDEKSPDFLSQ